MSNKSKRKLILFIYIIITIFACYKVYKNNEYINIHIMDKIILDKDDYEEIEKYYNEYNKLIETEKIVLDNYIYNVQENKLVEGEIRGMIETLEDPYSRYDSKETREFLQKYENNPKPDIGLGINILTDIEGNNIITFIRKGSEAESKGFKIGDKIISINNKKLEPNRSILEYQNKENPDEYNILYLRENNGEKIVLENKVNWNYEKIDGLVTKSYGDINYIKINSFNNMTDKYIETEIEKIKNSDINGIIIDIRDNFITDYRILERIAPYFLQKGDILYNQVEIIENKENKDLVVVEEDGLEIPLVLLINENTSGGSEIFAAAIKDNQRGKLVGNTTRGYGMGQSGYALSNNGYSWITNIEYFTPDNNKIEGVGIIPDIKVFNEVNGKDEQLDKAIKLLNKQF